jgi:hypothetical protein
MNRFIPEDVYEPYYDCESCVDYRKNLRCCREIQEILDRINALEILVDEILKENMKQK